MADVEADMEQHSESVAALAAALHTRLRTRRRDVLEDRTDAGRHGRRSEPREETADVRGGTWLLASAIAASDTPAVVHSPADWAIDHPTMRIDGAAVAEAFVCVAEALINHRRLRPGGGPHFAIPEVHDYREARLWNDVFCLAEQQAGVHHGSVTATVGVAREAEHELDEILYELRDYAQLLSTNEPELAISVEETNVRRGAGIERHTLADTSAPLSA